MNYINSAIRLHLFLPCILMLVMAGCVFDSDIKNPILEGASFMFTADSSEINSGGQFVVTYTVKNYTDKKMVLGASCSAPFFLTVYKDGEGIALRGASTGCRMVPTDFEIEPKGLIEFKWHLSTFKTAPVAGQPGKFEAVPATPGIYTISADAGPGGGININGKVVRLEPKEIEIRIK